MEYMILINSEERPDAPAPGTPEFAANMTDWMAFNQRLIAGGHWIAGGSLAPVATATTVRKAAGSAPVITDGPFAETKEQFGGFYLITAADLDEALAFAKDIPLVDATIEVRPMQFRPDAA